MPPDPAHIAQDGFRLPLEHLKIRSLAILSLRTALRAYFSTYRSMAGEFHELSEVESEGDSSDYLHYLDYCALYSQIIVHFHHFAELICKDFLRADDPLLVIDAARDPVLFHKLLRKEHVKPDEYEQKHTVEFSVAKDRLYALIRAQRLGSDMSWLVSHQPMLKELNLLRNRLLHRGVYILRYSALDKLVCAHVLPFVKQVVALDEYSEQTPYWKYRELACGIDPLDEITKGRASDDYDMKRIALLKELGRAAYENPQDPVRGDDAAKRAMLVAEVEVKDGIAAALRTCPVCGVKAFLRYDITEGGVWDGERFHSPSFPILVQCACCGLEIDSAIKNPSVYGLPIEDFW